MKHLLNILTFIFISVSVFGQPDSILVGKYSFVEQRGIHVEPGAWISNSHVTSYITHADTTIEYSLLLDSNYNSILIIDTTFGIFSGLPPYLKWYGKWEKINDTLLITFTELYTLWPYSFNGETPTPTIEKMTSQIIFEFVIKTYDNRIYGLELINDEVTIIYTKE
jgi:hypothetical protein